MHGARTNHASQMHGALTKYTCLGASRAYKKHTNLGARRAYKSYKPRLHGAHTNHTNLDAWRA